MMLFGRKTPITTKREENNGIVININELYPCETKRAVSVILRDKVGFSVRYTWVGALLSAYPWLDNLLHMSDVDLP
jgi:hypothetical protein